MNLSFYIARRYLISKKSHNAINLISTVVVCGVAVSTMAMVCTLSVFNGFQGLVSNMFSSFDPELKITPVKGKVFDASSNKIKEIKTLDGVALFSETLEDNVLIKYKDRQELARLKGVSDNFGELVKMDNILFDGGFKLSDSINHFATLGIGLASKVGVNAGFIYPIEIHTPKRKTKINLTNPASSFNRDYAYITAVFKIDQAVYDDHLMIVPLSLARSLFEYENSISSLEIRLKEGVNIKKVQRKIQGILGNEFLVQDRYQQQEEAFKMINIEKWMGFLILSFILLIATFNIIGTLSMLMIEKQGDIVVLRNLGADNRLISNIFLFEGWMISLIGSAIGLVFGLLLCFAQQKFGLIGLNNSAENIGGFTDSYPVKVAVDDLFFILITVVSIGFLAAIYSVKYLSKKWL